MSLTRRSFLAVAATVPFGARLAAGAVPDCEWCGAAEAPDHLTNVMTIAAKGEPGERIVLSGRILRPDGMTPAEGIVLYAYHTDITGLYTKTGRERGNGQRHGRLRSWLRTGADGRYEIRTIKPAGYPGRVDPQHIHATLAGDGVPEHWIESFWFEGDPRITAPQRAKVPRSAIVQLSRNGGILQGTRNLTLRA